MRGTGCEKSPLRLRVDCIIDFDELRTHETLGIFNVQQYFSSVPLCSLPS